MKKMRIILASVFFTCTWVFAQATPALSIVKGYGETEWGQSIDQVTAAVPGLELVAERDPYAQYKAPGNDVITGFEYVFLNDQLYLVKATIDLREDKNTVDSIGLQMLTKAIAAKYHEDAAVAAALKEAGIRVEVMRVPNATASIGYQADGLRRELEAAIQEEAEAVKKAAMEEALEGRSESQEKIDKLIENNDL
jgi:hypothetical protein